MADSVNFSSFPEDAIEAIAYLYVQQQDLSGKSPAEIYTLYQEAYYEIRKDHSKKQKAKWFSQKQAELNQS